MKAAAAVFILILPLWACQTLQPLPPAELAAARKACSDLFHDGHWQYVHTIDVRVHGVIGAPLTGISDVDYQTGRLRAVLVSLEGLTLFDAVFDGKTRINRALPPFDGPRLAGLLMDDVRFIFFQPEQPPAEIGRPRSGRYRCNYGQPDAVNQQITIYDDGAFERRRYAPDGTTARSLTGGSTGFTTGAARRMTLTAHDSSGYTLTFNLIRAEKIQ